MFFKEEVRPRISDFDRSGSFTYEAILQILETTGCRHSDAVHDNVIAGSRSGAAWMLVEWRIRIHSLPASTDLLKITTWVHGKAPTATVHRDFTVTNARGEPLFEAEAVLVLVDTARGRMTRISEELFASYGPEDKRVFPDTPGRLRAPETALYTRPITMRHSDIDFNGHVHNARYVDFALEALPPEARTPGRFSQIRIACSRAVKESDEAAANYCFLNNAHVVTVTGNNAPCTVIELK